MFTRIQAAITSGDLRTARSLTHQWLDAYLKGLQQQVNTAGQTSRLRPDDVVDVSLWQCLGDVVERTSDPWLLECLWQGLDRLELAGRQACTPLPALPLLGIPILNRIDLLERLLASLDHPVHTLAIVDNSGNGTGSLAPALAALAERPHPLINTIEIARPFGNLGVAASWNLILRAFPQAPLALLANNDVVFTSGVLTKALALLDPSMPQFLPLLPDAAAFSAFLITAPTWNRIGLFCEDFHPAYCEDLDYRDRLRDDPAINWVNVIAIQGPMQAANPSSSATIASDPLLAAANQRSFQVNRLWYLSRRRLRGTPSGQWLRRWLCEWPQR